MATGSVTAGRRRSLHAHPRGARGVAAERLPVAGARRERARLWLTLRQGWDSCGAPSRPALGRTGAGGRTESRRAAGASTSSRAGPVRAAIRRIPFRKRCARRAGHRITCVGEPTRWRHLSRRHAGGLARRNGGTVGATGPAGRPPSNSAMPDGVDIITDRMRRLARCRGDSVARTPQDGRDRAGCPLVKR